MELLLLKNMNKYILLGFNDTLLKLQVLQINEELPLGHNKLLKQKSDITKKDTSLFWLEVENSTEVEVKDIYDIDTQTFSKPYTLDKKKDEAVTSINDYCGFLITQEYPLYKQMNITNGLETNVSIAEMQAFIQSKRDKARELRGQVETIDNVKDLEELVENLQNLFD